MFNFLKSKDWENYSLIERKMLLQAAFQIGNLALHADGGYCADAQDNVNENWEYTKSYLTRLAKEMEINPERCDTTIYTSEQRNRAYSDIGQNKAIKYITEIKVNLIDTCSAYPTAKLARKEALRNLARSMNCYTIAD